MSTFGEIKDMVRAHFGDTGFSTTQLNFALAMGRREIENQGNWWWMRNDIQFDLITSQQDYPIGDSEHIDEAYFKDIIALSWKRSTDVQWEPLMVGDYNKEELDVMYQTDDTGTPETAIIDVDSLLVYPPIPDDAYNMKMYYYRYTPSPGSVLTEDTITKLFPEALMYAGIAMGYEQVLKDFQSSTYYRQLLGGSPYGRGGEIVKIRRENFKRGWRDNMMLTPYHGPFQKGNRRKLDNVQIYGSRWR